MKKVVNISFNEKGKVGTQCIREMYLKLESRKPENFYLFLKVSFEIERENQCCGSDLINDRSGNDVLKVMRSGGMS